MPSCSLCGAQLTSEDFTIVVKVRVNKNTSHTAVFCSWLHFSEWFGLKRGLGRLERGQS
ncbi:MAG: hypothetical protein HA494_08155 [Thaumarchaeota archaeon]|nr:hypothetical protein [Nitrososphaerota archaeon]